MSAPCLLNARLVSSCSELGSLCKRGKGDQNSPLGSYKRDKPRILTAIAGSSLGSKPEKKGPVYSNPCEVSQGRLPGRGGIRHVEDFGRWMWQIEGHSKREEMPLLVDVWRNESICTLKGKQEGLAATFH